MRSDHHCRNYIYYPYDISLLNQLPELIAAGLKYISIDAQLYNKNQTEQTLQIYQDFLHSWPGNPELLSEARHRLKELFHDHIALL